MKNESWINDRYQSNHEWFIVLETIFSQHRFVAWKIIWKKNHGIGFKFRLKKYLGIVQKSDLGKMFSLWQIRLPFKNTCLANTTSFCKRSSELSEGDKQCVRGWVNVLKLSATNPDSAVKLS